MRPPSSEGGNLGVQLHKMIGLPYFNEAALKRGRKPAGDDLRLHPAVAYFNEAALKRGRKPAFSRISLPTVTSLQ